MSLGLGLGFFSQFPRFSNSFSRAASSPAFVAAASALGLGIGLSLAANAIRDQEEETVDSPNPSNPSPHCHIGWASLSLSHANANAIASPVEPRTGEAFPQEVNGGRRLLGLGLRKTNVLGLKTIDVYAFGVYADDSRIHKLNHLADALETDVPITVRLQIVYSRLSIRSVRNAFAKSVGARLNKFGVSSDLSDTDQLLHKFVSLFKDDQKLPKGSVIELSREQGHVLRTTIDGKQVGQIESKLLCKSILDLYFGEDPLDKSAKEQIELNLASRLKTV